MGPRPIDVGTARVDRPDRLVHRDLGLRTTDLRQSPGQLPRHPARGVALSGRGRIDDLRRGQLGGSLDGEPLEQRGCHREIPDGDDPDAVFACDGFDLVVTAVVRPELPMTT